MISTFSSRSTRVASKLAVVSRGRVIGIRLAAVSSTQIASRCASGITVRPEQPEGEIAKRSEHGGAAAVRSKTEALANRAAGSVDRAASKIFAGSASGESYAPTTPVLSKMMGPQRGPRPQPACSSRAPTPSATAPVTTPEPVRSLAELKEMPTSDLRHMLAVRGVSLGNATEKEELARWVHAHQELPATRKDAQADEVTRQPKQPLACTKAELKEMSIKELRNMLAERGVDQGSATEKGELVEWVYQHRDLPVLRREQWRKGRGRRGFGMGGEGESYDVPPNEKPDEKEKQTLLDGGDETLLLEKNEEQRLLEGQVEEAKPRRWWLWALAGVSPFVLIISALAVNDAVNATETPAEASE